MLSSSEFHKDFLAFKISAREIGVHGLSFVRDLSKEALSALIFEPKNEEFSWRAQGPTILHSRLERENDHSFAVHLSAEVQLYCVCVRCLSPVNHSLSVCFFIRMLEREHLRGRNTNYENWQFESESVAINLDEEDLSVGYFSEQCIDLGVILREQIFMLVPDYPQCGSTNGSLEASCDKALLVLPNDDGHRESPFVKLFNKIK
jgi:uncharacterized metal-binding protein YceD (DUF177 family)